MRTHKVEAKATIPTARLRQYKHWHTVLRNGKYIMNISVIYLEELLYNRDYTLCFPLLVLPLANALGASLEVSSMYPILTVLDIQLSDCRVNTNEHVELHSISVSSNVGSDNWQ